MPGRPPWPAACTSEANGRLAMKTRYTVALSILAGVAVGAAAVQALHAQAALPAYVVAEISHSRATPIVRLRLLAGRP